MANDGVMLVNFGALDEAGGNIQAAIRTMQAKLDECNAIGARLRESWDGDAKYAYDERQTTWTNAARDLTEILIKIQSAVQQSTEDYMATEKQATQRFM